MCIYVCLEEKGIENFVIFCVLSIKCSILYLSDSLFITNDSNEILGQLVVLQSQKINKTTGKCQLYLLDRVYRYVVIVVRIIYPARQSFFQ